MLIVVLKQKNNVFIPLNRNIMKKLLFILLSVLSIQTISAQTLERVAPEQVGMDSRRLMYTDELIETARSIGWSVEEEY